MKQETEGMVSKVLYHKLANNALEALSERLDDEFIDAEQDYKDGNLQVKIQDIGEYVFNKQPYTMQIWASSPVTGPRKFDINRDGWTDSRSGVSLQSYIDRELEQIKMKQKRTSNGQ
ncbi:frataxin [Ordospora colligata]|uniref:Frataxin n=1 Tax=Ordospora colligata OC4 TaxID=1354746 RepID=A0A0B2UNC7_9MICR|nr:frataxin [Ordospora colligata OC4]KHN70470.1 frataxin [Ordospora colligata OC4]TBU17220.1 frataxin [Ordospora colligata]TBU17470.1 frataxin [Ordospora colligata]TBU19650.1 frataxin [Ordospora colligata]